MGGRGLGSKMVKKPGYTNQWQLKTKETGLDADSALQMSLFRQLLAGAKLSLVCR